MGAGVFSFGGGERERGRERERERERERQRKKEHATIVDKCTRRPWGHNNYLAYARRSLFPCIGRPLNVEFIHAANCSTIAALTNFDSLNTSFNIWKKPQ